MTDDLKIMAGDVADSLIGTQDALLSHLERLGLEKLASDHDFIAALDGEARQCCGCQYWCETSEFSEDDSECHECFIENTPY